MDIFEALFTRRSIRKYTEKIVSDQDIEFMLKSAMLAPSACNERPWHFIVIRDAQRRMEVSQTSPYTKMAAHAPLVIVVCGDLAEEKAEGFWVQDCSAAIENLLLAARGRGLGSVWCGVHPVAERESYLRKLLNLPENIVPLGLIVVGHPDQHFTEAQRFMPERVHQESW